ncbi:MAG: Lrp/AsnC family transcriptional regulator [Pseudomonadota bacterium]
MERLDKLDRQLLDELTLDGRATTTTLAARLNVVRATVKSRVERLQQEGIIRRFTIDVSSEVQPDMVRAVMLVQLEGAMSRAVISKLRRMPEISELYSTNGAWDLVAQLQTVSLPEFDRVLREIREIKGVLNSETCLLLNKA